MTFSLDEELWFGELTNDPAEGAAAASLTAQVALIHGLKPFPVAAQKLMSATRNPDFTVAAVTKIIEGDPTLATRVLRVINSAAYGLRKQCASVSHAVVLLGARTLSEVAASLAVLEMFQDTGGLGGKLRQHAVAVGAVARQLASHRGLPTDNVFTCGLLHDIGKLLMLQTETDTKTMDWDDQFANLLSAGFDKHEVMHEPERNTFGYDHAVLGGHVLQAWKIPDPVPTVVAWHHQPGRCFKEGGGIATLTSLVRLADRLSYVFGGEEPEGEDLFRAIAADSAVDYLGIDAAAINQMWDDLLSTCVESRDLHEA